jgi:predicted SAM-dependent methyltransferase
MDATRRWPWPDNSCGRVFMGQVIEHLPYPTGVRYALKEARRVLTVGGELIIICPDFLALKEKKVGAEVWRAEARGMCRWPGDEHRWMPNRNLVGAEIGRRFGPVLFLNHLNLDDSWPAGSRQPWDCTARAAKIPAPQLADPLPP